MSATFLVGYPENFLSNFWSSCFKLRNPKSFFWDGVPVREHGIVFEFSKRPKVFSIITVSIKNVKNDVLYVLCEGDPLRRARHHVTKKTAGLPLIVFSNYPDISPLHLLLQRQGSRAIAAGLFHPCRAPVAHPHFPQILFQVLLH